EAPGVGVHVFNPNAGVTYFVYIYTGGTYKPGLFGGGFYSGAGSETRQMRGARVPMVGLKPPMVIGPLASESQPTIKRALVALAASRGAPSRRPLANASRLRAPTATAAGQVFVGPKTPFVRTKPRPTRPRLAPPATLEPAVVALEERTLRVTLTRTR